MQMTDPVPQCGDVAPADSRVLVVDDNAQNRELLAAYLETIPVEVRLAARSSRAIRPRGTSR